MAASVKLEAPASFRQLPEHLFGFNSSVLYNFPYEDPGIVPLVAALEPSILRYPGGTESNFFDWRTGQMWVEADENSSHYRKSMAQWAPNSRRGHPNGCSVRDITDFCDAIGAEFVFVPNLETSSVEDQTEWFKSIHADGLMPQRIELGNEYWIATLNDPASLARFPDCDTTMKIMRDYVDAFRPYLRDDTIICTQAAGSRHAITTDPGPKAGIASLQWAWDDAMTRYAGDDWFQAVTIHLYPEVMHTAPVGSTDPNEQYPWLMARADAGTSRVIDDIVERLPGKEIWITEWGIGEIDAFLKGLNPRVNGMWINVVARNILAFLRHPEATILQYHGLMFDGHVWSLFRPDPDAPGRYKEMGPTNLLRWFHHAARPKAGESAEYATVAVTGASRTTLDGRWVGEEGFDDVVAGLFRNSEGSTLIIHNAPASDATIDISAIVPEGTAYTAEAIATPDLAEWFNREPAGIHELQTGVTTLTVPGHSTTRVHWA